MAIDIVCGPNGSASRARLVVRGKPEPGESFKGFCLRLAVANGSRDAYEILPSRIKIGRANALTIDTACTRHIEAIAGLEEGSLSQLGGVSAGPRSIKVAEGTDALPATMTDHMNAKICLTCIEERAFHRSIWDIGPLVCGPVHRTRLITACHKCGQRLTWKTSKLLMCCDGAPFSEVVPIPAHGDTVELARAICHAVDPRSCPAPTRLAPQLLSLSPAGLLNLVVVIGATDQGNFTKGRYNQAKREPELMADLVSLAASVLLDWPSGMPAFVTRLWMGKDSAVSALCSAADELGPWSQKVRSFKGDNLEFFREEFWACLNSLSPGLRLSGSRAASRARLLPTGDVSKILGVTEAWVRAWVRHGGLKSSTRTVKKRTRVLVSPTEAAALLARVRSLPVLQIRGITPRDPMPDNVVWDEAYLSAGHVAGRLRTVPGNVEALLDAGLLLGKKSEGALLIESASVGSLLARLETVAAAGPERPTVAMQLTAGRLIRLTSKLTEAGELAGRVSSILAGSSICLLVPNSEGLARYASAPPPAFQGRHHPPNGSGGTLSLLETARELGCPIKAAACLVAEGFLEDLDAGTRSESLRKRYTIPFESVENFKKSFNGLHVREHRAELAKPLPGCIDSGGAVGD